jgi:hypothetical protein
MNKSCVCSGLHNGGAAEACTPFSWKDRNCDAGPIHQASGQPPRHLEGTYPQECLPSDTISIVHTIDYNQMTTCPELTTCLQDFNSLPHADKLALTRQPYNFLEQVTHSHNARATVLRSATFLIVPLLIRVLFTPAQFQR